MASSPSSKPIDSELVMSPVRGPAIDHDRPRGSLVSTGARYLEDVSLWLSLTSNQDAAAQAFTELMRRAGRAGPWPRPSWSAANAAAFLATAKPKGGTPRGGASIFHIVLGCSVCICYIAKATSWICGLERLASRASFTLLPKRPTDAHLPIAAPFTVEVISATTSRVMMGSSHASPELCGRIKGARFLFGWRVAHAFPVFSCIAIGQPHSFRFIGGFAIKMLTHVFSRM